MNFLFPANGIHHSAYSTISDPKHTLSPLIYPPLNNPPPPIPNPLTWHFIHSAIQSQLSGDNHVGMGHSLGAALLLYDALKHPGRWNTIVIVEPALFSKTVYYLTNIIRFLKLEMHLHPMIRLTKHRRETFPDTASVFQRWRKHASFSAMSDDALQQFIDASLIADGNHYKLRFPKDWEMAIYASMCTLDPFIWANLHTLTSKLIVVAGETSNTFMPGARQRLKKQATEFLTIPNTSHLLPFETPQILRTIIKRESNL